MPCSLVSVVPQVDQLSDVVVAHTLQELQGLCGRARNEVAVVDEAETPRLLPKHDSLEEEIVKGRITRPRGADRPHLDGALEDLSPFLRKPDSTQTCQRPPKAVPEDLDALDVCLRDWV